MNSHIVIGAGEVGKAIEQILLTGLKALGGRVYLRDIEGGGGKFDVMHICFPWTKDFEADVDTYYRLYQPTLLIIHSTVPVGTSRSLGAVHSPIAGRHPTLRTDLMYFTKFFAGEGAEEAAAIFRQCGLTTRVLSDLADVTEAGKLWQTLQYGWAIAIQKEAYRDCAVRGLDPELVYRTFNTDYNLGNAALGRPYWLPILEDMPGPIGGHCVVPNLELLDTPLATGLARLNELWAAEAIAEPVS